VTQQKISEIRSSAMDAAKKDRLLSHLELLRAAKIVVQKSKSSSDYEVQNLSLSKCLTCEEVCLWKSEEMIFPPPASAFVPNVDIPDHIQADFIEAAAIVEKSPRGAAALLRLCMQKLFRHLGCTGKDLTKDVDSLVLKGLNSRVREALEVVRIIGDHTILPGRMDLRDDAATAISLFNLVNIIADQMISQPKNLSGLLSSLPSRAGGSVQLER
jgi:hypothetical protein